MNHFLNYDNIANYKLLFLFINIFLLGNSQKIINDKFFKFAYMLNNYYLL